MDERRPILVEAEGFRNELLSKRNELNQNKWPDTINDYGRVAVRGFGFAKGAGKLGWGCRDLTALVDAGATPPIRRDSVCPEHTTGPSCEQQVSSHVFRRDELKPSLELTTRLIANGCIKRMET